MVPCTIKPYFQELCICCSPGECRPGGNDDRLYRYADINLVCEQDKDDLKFVTESPTCHYVRMSLNLRNMSISEACSVAKLLGIAF